MANENKIALVTGGSRGLGKDMALNLAQKGLDVILTYNSKSEDAAAVVKEVEAVGRRAAALQLNVGEIASFDGFIAKVKVVLKNNFGAEKLDYLINNAGIGIYALFAETTEEQFDNLLNIHFKGSFFLTQKLLPVMTDGGGIVNISSGLARFSSVGYAAYGAMKGAIESLTRYQARELGARGIRSNAVAPGAIETDFGNGFVRDNPELNKQLASLTALGRVGKADDIGSVVAFLCTNDAKWINGQRIEVTGGFNI